ncbi:ribbon-helix-helix domain-containing protein [Myxococcota bacterium]|nr:ribbon-helix-helix domain-containing protein [Myxococcota bacterium]MBU1429280.1 ribbon-helix-helix domain-containing protein [Myxococcota bacterium]MBU1898941.1 ribbon-helix-helix domain-containing protein [Myxococcota bacterium]
MSELFDDFFFESIGGQHIVIKDDPVPQRPPMQAEPPPEPRQRPSHYKVISISLYTQDLEQLDALVKAAKARGLTRMSRSQLIREALRQVDLAQIPPQR